MEENNKELTVIARECRFALHGKARTGDDIHFVKEIEHLSDGTTRPNLRVVKNYKRPVWISKKATRTYKQKKDYEDIKNLDMFMCTQNDMYHTVATALGTPWVKGSFKSLCTSPHVYGTDTKAAALIKNDYSTKYPNTNTAYTVGVFDVETDVLHGTGEIIMASFTCKTHSITAIKKSFFNGFANPMEMIELEIERELAILKKERNIKFDIVLVDTELDILRYVIGKMHIVKPDYAAVWNIDFDMNKVIDACKRRNIPIEDLLSDPSIPVAYRYFEHDSGQSSLTTAAGVHKNFAPHHKWPVTYVPSTFIWIDAMCAYKKVRNTKPEEKGYSLDAVLKRNNIPEKLKFQETEGLDKYQTHVFLQKNYPAKYVVYNIYDCICIELLDEKTLDLAWSVPILSGNSGIELFHSNPKKLVDAIHTYAIKEGKVLSSTGKVNGTEFDNRILGRKGWIVMLDPFMNEDNTGLNCIIENKNLTTNIRVAVYDADKHICPIKSYLIAGSPFRALPTTANRKIKPRFENGKD